MPSGHSEGTVIDQLQLAPTIFLAVCGALIAETMKARSFPWK